jgi:hypothetical protein
MTPSVDTPISGCGWIFDPAALFAVGEFGGVLTRRLGGRYAETRSALSQRL